MKKILLNGPEIELSSGFYGGGQGGMARNMVQYVTGFRSDEFEIEPCFHSVRQPDATRWSFVTRLFSDVGRLLRQWRSADGVHILSQYRTAIYREYAIVLACWLRGLPVLYEIKAGAFIKWLETCRPWERAMAHFILRRARVVMCEGQVYVDYLRDRLRIESHYAPNYVLSQEIPADVRPKLMTEKMCVLFVGYCYEGKGVFELVEGCELAAKKGVPVELTLAGHEDDDFTRFLDDKVRNGLQYTLNRMGRIDHDVVLKLFSANDAFCMPTRHSGEGHTNTVNEAMMMGMVIISTRHGFLEDVLSGDASYFLDRLSPEDICDRLAEIHRDRDEARRRARAARERLMQRFTSETAFANLTARYRELTKGC